MKKIILILLSLVLICAMCIGFVACNSLQSLYDFAKKNEFSFGKFVEDEVMENGYRKLYEERYDEATASANEANPYFGKYSALFLENDSYFDEMMNVWQGLYNDHVEKLGAELFPYSIDNALKSQQLIDYIERKKVAFSDNHDSSITHTMVLYTNVGEKGYYGCVLKEKKVGNYTCRYTISFFGETIYGNVFDSLRLVFGVYFLDSRNHRVADLGAMTELFWYPEDSEEATLLQGKGYRYIIDALNRASIEELYKMGMPYFDVMEEVIDAWLKDPRGQAYINKYA